MNRGDKVYLLRGREIHAVTFHDAAMAPFQRDKWCCVTMSYYGRTRAVDVPLADVFPSDYAARVALHNRKAAQIAEAEARVAELAAFDPFAVVVVDRTGAV